MTWHDTVFVNSYSESTVRLLLDNRQQKSATIYTESFPAYEPLEEDDTFTRKYVIHGDGEYGDRYLGEHPREPCVVGATMSLPASRCVYRQAHTTSPSVSLH